MEVGFTFTAWTCGVCVNYINWLNNMDMAQRNEEELADVCLLALCNASFQMENELQCQSGSRLQYYRCFVPPSSAH